ncbi:LOW QUALITY PROTEIN: perforin-1-like [Chelonoidis abingdonii]|uniref:LOW QUALITY PROTEIN: perforin-1-like n=1 Tax=Chelonoidis abingdonii TaxID=106734 RepID=UPI0013F1F051|nr:LOW QUALITY PROTEIN: perforin-1-like [Chelonoidis abingdonii]
MTGETQNTGDFGHLQSASFPAETQPSPGRRQTPGQKYSSARLLRQEGSAADSPSRVGEPIASAMPRFGAFIPLLLFIFPGASSHCHIGTANECEKHTTFVPGHSLAGEGIDVTTMGRKGAYLVDSSLWQYEDGTCTLCQNRLQGGQWQRLPLAAVDWRVRVSCRRKLSSSVQQSAMDMMESAASAVQNDWKVGLDVPVKPKVNVQVALAGSQSKLASFVVDHTRMDKYSFMSHEVSCGYYRFRVSETPPLTSHFTLALENLPDQYDSKSKVEYQELISNYGTHYMSQLQLGGRARDVTAVRVCKAAMSSLSEDEIKDCLSMEAAVSIGVGSVKGGYSKCEEEKKKGKVRGSFHETYQERHVEVEGGEITTDVLFSGHDAKLFSAWIESLKASPGLVSYSLHPIHILVEQDDPKREALRQAVSEYILEKALVRNCTRSCPPGTQRSAHDPCSCICPGDAMTNTMCCSRERGLGKLMVTVKKASGLWGDQSTATDAFVKVFFESREIRTSTIWNNNSPVWYVPLDFGTIHLTSASKIRVQVWDEDKWDDDLLGSCDIPLEAGGPHQKDCYLNHGRIWFQYSLRCGPHLGGRSCFDYVSQPPQQSTAKGKEVEAFW